MVTRREWLAGFPALIGRAQVRTSHFTSLLLNEDMTRGDITLRLWQIDDFGWHRYDCAVSTTKTADRGLVEVFYWAQSKTLGRLMQRVYTLVPISSGIPGGGDNLLVLADPLDLSTSFARVTLFRNAGVEEFRSR